MALYGLINLGKLFRTARERQHVNEVEVRCGSNPAVTLGTADVRSYPKSRYAWVYGAGQLRADCVEKLENRGAPKISQM